MNRLFLILALLFAALPAGAGHRQVPHVWRRACGLFDAAQQRLCELGIAPGSLGSGTPNTVRGTTITATTQFTGSGAGLTNVPAASVTGSPIRRGHRLRVEYLPEHRQRGAGQQQPDRDRGHGT